MGPANSASDGTIEIKLLGTPQPNKKSTVSFPLDLYIVSMQIVEGPRYRIASNPRTTIRSVSPNIAHPILTPLRLAPFRLELLKLVPIIFAPQRFAPMSCVLVKSAL